MAPRIDFRIWAETAKLSETGSVIPWPDVQPVTANPHIVIFLKYFDIEAQDLKGVTNIYVRKNDKVQDIAPEILRIMNWPAGANLKLYEEIKPSMIDIMKPKQSFNQAEIQDGDIVCFQKQLPEKEAAIISQKGDYVDAKEFYDYLLNRTMVQFHPRFASSQEKDTFSLELSRKMPYDQYAAKVGEKLDVDPAHLRFWTVTVSNGNPKSAVKRNTGHTLSQTLTPQYGMYGVTPPSALYYEVLDFPLAEMESKKAIKVSWLTEGIMREVSLF